MVQFFAAARSRFSAAYALVLEARAKEAGGAPMEALPLYMRAAKVSREVKRMCQL